MVTTQGRTIPDALTKSGQDKLPVADQALAQEIVYGTIRWLPRLEYLLGKLLQRPIKETDEDVVTIILVGLYQLCFMRIPDHAAVNETVALSGTMKKPWARGLINGVLRTFIREKEVRLGQADTDLVGRTAHPPWLANALRKEWPAQANSIFDANNQRPPLTLRVNSTRCSREAYLAKLSTMGVSATLAPHTLSGITLDSPIDVTLLPGFADGEVSVQDGAAQLAAPLVAPQPGERILDACAAPGGKTTHLLETQANLATLIALDIDEGRLAQIRENLQRQQLSAELRIGDVNEPASWWDGVLFDKILLDVPCSATGVIRRHPDIKILRRANDIAPLAQYQWRLLRAAWALLKPGGTLLYSTCSILPAENSAQVLEFLRTNSDASERIIDAAWGQQCQAGRQILPGEDNMDGFFYAVLQKH